MASNISASKKLFIWAIIWYPVLSTYRAFVYGFTIGDLALIVSSIILLSTEKNAIYISKTITSWYLVFYIYCLIIFFILGMLSQIWIPSIVIKRYVKLGMFIFILVYLCPTNLDYKIFKDTYRNLVIIVVTGLIIQYIFYYVGFGYIELKIPFLSYTSDELNSFDIVSSRTGQFRPSSIFVEPATCTYFLIQYLILELFEKNEKKRIIMALILSLFVLMTVSSTAFITTLVIWLLFLANLIYMKKISISKKMVYFVWIVFGVGMIYSVVVFSNEMSYALDRLLFSMDASLATSAWKRIEAGAEYFKNSSTEMKIFGNGLGNYPSSNVYVSGINFILYGSGIIGASIMVFWAISALRKANATGIAMTVIFIMLNISSPLFYSGLMLSMNSIILLNYKRFSGKVGISRSLRKYYI